VEINVPYPEALEQRQHIIDKMYPLDTVMDLVRIEMVYQERMYWYSTCTIFSIRVLPWLFGLLLVVEVTQVYSPFSFLFLN
jgi:hypothetical protein